MKKLTDLISFIIGIYGELAGLSLIALVSGWDVLIQGARGFFEYAIGWRGIMLIWLGAGLILMSKRLQKTWK